MDQDPNIKLTSAEMGSLWTTYMNDSMAVQVITYFLNHVQDQNLKGILEFALKLSENHLDELTQVFHHENHPIPHGFTQEDVDVSAPQLFSESFILLYMNYMGKSGLQAYTMSLSFAARKDIRNLFSKYLKESITLMDKSTDALLSKGIYTRPPYIPTPESVDFVQKKNYVNGWFGKRRPLNAIEITHIFGNLKTNEVGKSLITGFAQVAKSGQIRDFFMRGKKIATKHTHIFSTVLQENDLPATMTADTNILPSKDSPFSDKLMMYHISAMISIGIAKYGSAMAVSMRHDLAFQYAKLVAEIGTYAEDGADLMIERGWMEQPPQVPDYEGNSFY